jgi:hypothetical protein
MQIPVLLRVKTHPRYQASAKAALSKMGKMEVALDTAASPSYPNVELDAKFAAVPLGKDPGEGEVSPTAATPEEADFFAIRGHLEVERPDQIPTRAGEAEVFADPMIASCITCGGSPPVGNTAAVAAKLHVARLEAKGLNGSKVAVAVVDTGIDLPYLQQKLGHAPNFDGNASWSPPGTPPPNPGNWPLAHATMCAYDVLIASPKAILVDFPVLSAHYPGSGSIMSGTLSAAVAAYGFMLGSWANGALSKHHALVATNSWGIFNPSWDFPPGHPGRYCDNPHHPFNLQMRTATHAGIDVLFAAGNCGAPCADIRCQGRTVGAIMGASAMKPVLTIAGCDTQDDRVGYSSQGPSIAGMYQQKPDVTAYTHFLGSEVFGTGSPDSGTSAACPTAAGCVAALRTKISPKKLSPEHLFDVLRDTARPHSGPPHLWNGDYGFGIIEPMAAAAVLHLH